LANEQDEEQLLALGSNGYLVKADFTPTQFVFIRSILDLSYADSVKGVMHECKRFKN
jgi:hypothetical protein